MKIPFLSLVTLLSCINTVPVMAETVTPSQEIRKLLDEQIGTWKLNLKESRIEGQPYKSGFTVVIRHAYPITDWTYTADEAGPDGKKIVFSFKGYADGKVHPNEGAGGTYAMELLPDGIVDAKLWSASGEFENKFCIPYANKIKIICLATVDSKDGKRTMFTNVLDKVSDATE